VSAPLVALVADDEPLARQALRRALDADGGVTIAGEAEDVPSLRRLLATVRADVLFLDVLMPGGTGLDAVPHVPPGTALVFTTAHREHAATAFALDAVDYLVKPFGHDRVREALARVRRRASVAPDAAAGATGAHVAVRAATHTSADTPARASRPPLDVLLVRVGPRIVPVPVATIRRIEGADDCVRLVTAERAWFHGVTLQELEAQLDPARFVRVHRRHLVNLAQVASIEPHDERRLAVVFADGSRVACSRTGSALVRRLGRG
jgi:two-component system LytT family response regulator